MYVVSLFLVPWLKAIDRDVKLFKIMGNTSIMIIFVPINIGAVGIKGQEQAPRKIWEELRKYESTWSLNRNRLRELEPVELDIDNSNIEEAHRAIGEAVYKYMDNNPIFIGGDHSLTFPVFKALMDKYRDMGIIILDAHPDLEPYTINPSHDSWLRMLIDKGLDPSRVIILGVRSIGEKEAEFIKERGIRIYNPLSIENDPEAISDIVMTTARNWEKIWISLDIDVIDPSFAPGTYYNEPLGLKPLTLLYFLRRLLFLKNIIGLDLVEVNPLYDNRDITSRLAARLLVEALEQQDL